MLVIDIEHHAVLIVTVAACFIVFGIYGYIFFGLLGELLGILTGMGITFFLYFLGIVMAKIVGTIRGEEIEEVAFGFGDVLMGTVLGALTGWPSIFGVVVIALISFAVFSIIYFLISLTSKRYQAFTTALPFVPFLILGTIIVFYL